MKRTVFSIVMMAIVCSTYAQSSLEFGLKAGTSFYLGDLKPDAIQLTQNSPALGLQSKLNFNDRISARLSLTYGTIKGADSKTNNPNLIARNLSFRSRISEVAAIGEFNIFRFGQHKLNDSHKKYVRFTPYVFAGIALFNFKPKAELQGEWYDLHSYGTEGQNVSNSNVAPYSLTQISIPAGLGFKFELKPNFILGYELGWRKTFTDYLDDVSGAYYDKNELEYSSGILASKLAYRGNEIENSKSYPRGGVSRGNSQNKDWYILSQFSLSYKLFRTNNGTFESNYF